MVLLTVVALIAIMGLGLVAGRWLRRDGAVNPLTWRARLPYIGSALVFIVLLAVAVLAMVVPG